MGRKKIVCMQTWTQKRAHWDDDDGKNAYTQKNKERKRET